MGWPVMGLVGPLSLSRSAAANTTSACQLSFSAAFLSIDLSDRVLTTGINTSKSVRNRLRMYQTMTCARQVLGLSNEGASNSMENLQL
jgi:hypothetical protein